MRHHWIRAQPSRTPIISHNTWIHRFVRLGVRPLARTSVRPNHLTMLRLATAVAAAGAFAVGEPPWHFYGGVLFILSFILDRADGELARLGGKTSPSGHDFDLIADAISNALVFLGIGIGLRASVLGLWAVAMGALAGAAMIAILLLVLRLEKKEGPRAAEMPGAAGFDPDDAILIVPVAMMLGGGVPLMVAAAIGTPAFAVFFFWRFRRGFGEGGSGGPRSEN